MPRAICLAGIKIELYVEKMSRKKMLYEKYRLSEDEES